jgi:tRNA threonylcarbamoyladenosine biosynthesis protein TsaB
VVGLAIETSSVIGSLALFEFKENFCAVLSSKEWNRENSHAEFVTGELQKLLAEFQLSTQQLDLISVGVGPGSFTGVRVGINVARSLAYAHGLPVYPVNSLRVLAEQGRDHSGAVITLVNAYKNSVFTARFARIHEVFQEVEEPRVLAVEELSSFVQAPTMCLGDATTVYDLSPAIRSYLLESPSASRFPRARDLAEIAGYDRIPGSRTVWENVKPLYIRASSAEENLERRK